MGVSSKQGAVEEINTGLMIVNSLGECRRFEMLNDIEMGRRLVWKFLFFFSSNSKFIICKRTLIVSNRDRKYSRLFIKDNYFLLLTERLLIKFRLLFLSKFSKFSSPLIYPN